jgi:hypothetical protein
MNEILNIQKYTEWSPINEFQIPNVKLDEFLYNTKIASPRYTKILVQFYKSYEQYIDLLDKKKHQYNINDLTGDILGNERVKFKSIIFDKDDIDIIRENFVSFARAEFFSELPDSLDIFGIKCKPLSFIDKELVKYTFEQSITFDTALNIVTQLTDMAYEGEYQGYYIWSDKNKKQKPFQTTQI